MNKNLILTTDSYKQSHFKQYPEGMTYMHDYIESRGGAYGYTKFFGLQYYLKEYLSKPVTMEMVEEAKEICKLHGVPFNYEGWKYIAEELRYIPVKIRAVPEGSIIPNHNVLVTVESTDEKVAWIAGFVETLIMKVWYPITVATFSYKIKQIIKHFLEKTSDNVEAELPFKFHDFGYRGVSSEESAGVGGMSHLTNFKGTDTLASVLYAKKYYGAEMAGFSIPASEHSTMTSWGRENEAKAFENIIDSFEGPMSIVSDSYNYFNAVDYIVGEDLKEKIKNHNGTIIIRPDSGDAVTNVLFALESLERNFDVSINSKGYKVLNNVRVIQGDGINENTIWDLCKVITENGYSVENVAFGCGGALLQGNFNSSINRDTHKFAMKCSAAIINGKLIDIYKNPITDRGKVSKKGILDLVYENGNFKTVNIEKNNPHKNSIMQTVFENGKILKEYNFEEVRENEKMFPEPNLIPENK
jgi:nicotinamide phosphoribosyltransferase